MMHVLDIWLEQLKVFYPANLKIFVLGIATQLAATFKFLFVDWWWLSLFLLFSPLVTGQVASVADSCMANYFSQIIVFALQGYFAFLAALYTFPTGAFRSPAYIASRQPLFWPIVTPFVLWMYFRCHVYKFIALLITPAFLLKVIEYASYALLINVGWFASPLFVFFAFMIISTYVQQGVRYALEHAFALLWYMYPLCLLMFGCVYGLQILLEYGLEALALVNPWLLLFFNPMAILIPVAVVLFGAVYRWYMELANEVD